MKVYVLEVGSYENRYIVGVFATPEAAMNAHRPKPLNGRQALRGSEYGRHAGTPWSYEWESVGEGEWGFGADWDDAAGITEYDVLEAAVLEATT